MIHSDWLLITSCVSFIVTVICAVTKYNKTKKQTIVFVDYTKTLEQAIADCKFDSVDACFLAENFPIPLEMVGKKVKVVFEPLIVYQNSSLNGVISELKRDGYRPINIQELLAYSLAHPEVQQFFPIASIDRALKLGDGDYVPIICGSDKERRLDVALFGPFLTWSCIFFRVRK